jgi:hypothetical protein
MPLATPQGTLDFKSVDTITFVGASSNTVIDTTTGSFGVGVDANGPTSNLHVVGDALITGNVADLNIVSNVNMLHTSNTASLKLNSNVVTEFPRSKKLIKYPRVAMTGPSAPTGYAASASTALGSGWEPYRAFNTIAGGAEGWHDQGSTYSTGVYTGSNSVTPVTGSAVEGEWIQIQLPGKIKLEKVRLAPRETYTYRMPKDATILGSNNGTDWYRVASWSGQTYLSGNNYATIDIDSEQYYNYYVLVVEALGADAGGNSVNIGEWELYGTPEYDPEAHGVDVVVKSVPNVPNTDWLEVYYDAKDYTSGVVPDLSTNSLNGTLTNGATFDNSDGIGKFTFDGSNDYISGSIPSTFTGNQTYTFSTWIKPTSHPSSGFIGIFEAGTRSDDDSFGLYLNAGNIVHLAYGTNLATTTLAPVGQWTHIIGTYTSGDRKVYANGVLLGQDTYSALTLAGTTLVVGANSGGTQPFTGSIANFRLFNRALTTDEIYQLYAYQKEYFGHGDLSMTLKNGRLGIGTSEPRAALDVRGVINAESFYGLNDATVAYKYFDSDTINHTFSNLNLKVGEAYKIVWSYHNTTSNHNVHMFVNGDETDTNYWHAIQQVTGSFAAAGSTYNTAKMFSTGGSSDHIWVYDLRLSHDGRPMMMGHGHFSTPTGTMSTGSNQSWRLGTWYHNNQTAAITSLKFDQTSTGSFGAGSSIRILKTM